MYVKGPMNLYEFKSRNYLGFRLSEWKEYIASRSDKLKGIKALFYTNGIKTMENDKHILVSNGHPFLKRNLEIRYHRFIYAYKRKLGASKYVLNIKNILIEYFRDKVKINHDHL